MDNTTHHDTEPVVSDTRSNGAKPETAAVPLVNGAGVANPVVHRPQYRFEAEGHVHTLNGLRLHGTSTIANVLSKEGLTWWSAELAAVACLESGEHIPTIREEYAKITELFGKDKKNARDRLQRKYPIFKAARYAHKQKKDDTADEGHANHKNLQDYIEACIYDNHGAPIQPEGFSDSEQVGIFADWALNNVIEFLWAEAHCYSERLWVGGICDGGAMMKGGGLAILDFKRAQEARFSMFVQAGGYALQIKENGLWHADGSPISTGITHVNAAALIVWPFGGKCEPKILRNVAGYQAAFEAAVCLHKLQKLYEDGADFAPTNTLRAVVDDRTAIPSHLAGGADTNLSGNGAAGEPQTDGELSSHETPTQNLSEPTGIAVSLAEITRRNS